MKPVVVLIGRPNVGKSTLFNRLTRSRAALVADEPGLTRDRQYGDGRVGDRPYLVVDTGGVTTGLGPAGRADVFTAVLTAQTRQALAEADAVVLLVDGREGLTPLDRQIADDLRRMGKPMAVAVNKTEGVDPATAVAEFHALGLGEPTAISSARGDGVQLLMERVLAPLPVVIPEEAPAGLPRIAVIGRPNAGKSTLVNALLGEERVVVSDQPGTTRDSIHVPLERGGKSYILIDTAGVRRRGRVASTLEKYSVIKTLQAIDEADVAILVLDVLAGVAEQDAALAGYVAKCGRGIIVAGNKWDAIDAAQRRMVKHELQRKLPFLEYAPIHYISALHGSGVGALFGSVDAVHAATNKTIATSKLNQVLRAAVAATPPPVVRGRRIRLKFAHQAGKRPPLILVHGTQVGRVPESYRRYLAGVFRKAFGLVGTPVRVEFRQGKNPYAPGAGRRAAQAQ
ncbi:MAG: ribosome biogenesis GTPase Der [Candidatus Muproteobacteria bacterium RIFCSPHIGHO2_01_FULL_65_16]|uniref:GTPase Der n=3 Tax=Candidatus Muproteobacteria TaxID=1817795 RepID=A0A1F6TJI1_9PROT|nr:MAG: ribosome biogenesis GTPase Der [Candidatus Muproteobacteria bacterium RIFCSPHIGHO2_01_FULL_65_16]OGI45225.1 MAG: ribosome biogenesis GTPase Der [Candidatus Muproteobacteria bacterium RBG_16_65_31]OGI49968.1 MAG: ribosome biogenesis GTPase Der [Candidatus Muproteobacteria bacterium RIFCSPHIGHO2_02_FULL_65_16]